MTNRLVHLTWIGLAFVMVTAAAQTNTFPSSGNVGIGTTAPASLLDINGASTATSSNNYNSGALHLTGNYWNGSASASDNWTLQNNFGTGANPTSTLTFTHSGTSGLANIGFYSVPNGIVTFGHTQSATSSNNYSSPLFQILGTSWTGTASQNEVFNMQTILGTGANPTTTLKIWHSGGSGLAGMQVPNLGVNGPPSTYALDVTGQIHTSQGVVYPDGSAQTTAWTGVLCGGDYAESVEVTGDRTRFAPGDVLVIDPDHAGRFLKSAEAYSTGVTGIYSTKPGMVGRREKTPRSPDEVPMAMTGIVPLKVSAENGPIKPGDLLVTSSTFGYAMKGTDRSRMFGAIVGKALGSLDSGTGVIETVVALQ